MASLDKACGKFINNNNSNQQEQGEGFNYNQIIEGIGLNSPLGLQTQEVQQVAAPAPPQGSRFIQFLARTGGGQGGVLHELEDSGRGSLQEELGTSILKEVTGKGGGPSIRIPSPNQEDRYFGPVPAAAPTRTSTYSLLDMS